MLEESVVQLKVQEGEYSLERKEWTAIQKDATPSWKMSQPVARCSQGCTLRLRPFLHCDLSAMIQFQCLYDLLGLVQCDCACCLNAPSLLSCSLAF